jgi:hypothetical protein
MRKHLLTVAFLAIGVLTLRAVPAWAAEDIRTPAEESRYSRYTQNNDIARFLSALDFASRRTAVMAVGRTLATEHFPAADIFLAVITDEGVASPDQLNRAKPTILVVASQHGDEQSAKEAALRLCRDLAAGELSPLLKALNFLVIPQANPYGNLFDRRQNEQGLDLNRDHVKLESPEVRAIHRVFRTWLPEVTLDLHEKGDDYYRVSLGCVSNANISSRLQDFSRSVILADVERSLEKSRVTFHEYLVTEEMGVNTSAGANLRPEDLAGREEMTRYSTTDLNDGRNSLGIYQTLSFIQECASRHDLATLEQRTRWQYLGVRSFSEAVARRAADLLSLVRGLRAALVENAGNDSGGAVALRMDYVRDESQPTLTLKKFETTDSPVRGILKVDKRAGEPVLASDLAPTPWPREYKVETELVKNWFPRVAVSLSVPRPLGYIIPAARRDAVDCLLAHGVEVGVFIRDASLDAEMYLVREVTPAPYDYLPPEKMDVEKKERAIVVRRGDYFVSCRQPGADLIPCLLEPQSAYGFIRYRSFDLVPDAGDFYALSRLVKPTELPLIPYCPWGTTP